MRAVDGAEALFHDGPGVGVTVGGGQLQLTPAGSVDHARAAPGPGLRSVGQVGIGRLLGNRGRAAAVLARWLQIGGEKTGGFGLAWIFHEDRGERQLGLVADRS